MSIFIPGILIIALISALLYQNIRICKQNEMLTTMSKWHDMALTDALTQIPNRLAYSNKIKELEGLSQFTESVAIMLFDIDNFKSINDFRGHIEGDKTLRKCANVLSEIFSGKEHDVFRIGGDEFAVISIGLTEQQLVDKLLEIRDKEENDLDFTLSKGYAFITSQKDFQRAFKCADEMLYADKANTN